MSGTDTPAADTDTQEADTGPTKIIAGGVKVVAFLLAAFGGFLTNIAPPEETGIKLVLGLASMACLILFFIVSAMAKDLGRAVWLAVAGVTGVAFVVGAVQYQQVLIQDTFTWPQTGVRYVSGGTHYTPAAQPHAAEVSTAELVGHFGGMAEGVDSRFKVWTPESIQHARLVLTWLYLLTVLSAAIAVFALTEGALAARASKSKAKAAKVAPPKKHKG